MTDSAIQPRVAAVILAAGMSRRMGSAKALLDLGGKPIIRHVTEGLQHVADISPIIVVTGHQPQLIRDALAGQCVTFVHNADYATGEMLSSVKAGAAAVAGVADAFFLMLVDQPLVQHQSLQAMWEAWQVDRPPLLAPTYRGKRGHPILIASAGILEILSLDANASLRDFVERHREQAQVLELNDSGVSFDLDTPEDYQAMLKLWQSQRHEA